MNFGRFSRFNAVEIRSGTPGHQDGDYIGAVVAKRENGDVLVRFDKSRVLRWVPCAQILLRFLRV